MNREDSNRTEHYPDHPTHLGASPLLVVALHFRQHDFTSLLVETITAPTISHTSVIDVLIFTHISQPHRRRVLIASGLTAESYHRGWSIWQVAAWRPARKAVVRSRFISPDAWLSYRVEMWLLPLSCVHICAVILTIKQILSCFCSMIEVKHGQTEGVVHIPRFGNSFLTFLPPRQMLIISVLSYRLPVHIRMLIRTE